MKQQIKHSIKAYLIRGAFYLLLLIAVCAIPFALAFFAPTPAAQGAPPPKPEDRGNFNSAAENVSALNPNTTGTQNEAHGWYSLFSDAAGSYNTADGFQALYSDTSGGYNTATGNHALFSNISGSFNTADGNDALYNNTGAAGGGNLNTATGYQALYSNSSGNGNTAIGQAALYNSSTGINNTAIGTDAGFNVFTASNVTCIGANAYGADVSNTTWTSNVYAVTTQNATTAPVIVSADGQLGVTASSERFKKDIATMDKTSEAILSLRPVTFHYKSDTKSAPQFGLIAEEVAKVNPALVLLDKEGKPYTVRYDAVNAMLLNEFLKEHRKVEQQEATIAQLRSTVARQETLGAKQQKEIEALAATAKEQAGQIQKVSAQLETRNPAPQVVSSRP